MPVVADRRRRHDGPAAVLQGLVGALPVESRGALPSRVAELDADLRRAEAMDEIDQAPPRGHVFVHVDARAPRRDPPVAPDGGHLGHDEPRTADCPGAEVDEVPVVDRSVPGGVLAHGRHAHPVGQGQLTQAKRREERGRRRAGARGRSGAGGLLIPSIPPSPPSDPQRGLVLGDRHAGLGFGLSGHPAVDLVHERGVALPQVLVRNAQTSRQEREGELHRFQAEVALGVLEPLKAGLGGTLQRLDRTTALGLVGGQGLGKRPCVGRAGTDPPQRLGQRHAVEHG